MGVYEPERRGARLRGVLLLLGLSPFARPSIASELRGSEIRNVVLVNPLGTALGVVAASASVEAKELWSLSLRFEHTFTRTVGLTLAPQIARSRILAFQLTTLGLKFGPRFLPFGGNWAGLYVHPVSVVARSYVSQPNRSLISSYLLGTGGEVGYAWAWGHYAVEVGAGAYYSTYVGHTAFDGRAAPSRGIKPLLNSSVGYAW